MAKRDGISQQLKQRILHGNYAFRALPGEKQLAVDLGVSYMTARKVVQGLIETGLLVRGPNGRVTVNRSNQDSGDRLPIVLLSPNYISPGFERWRHWLARATDEVGVRLQCVHYTHWDDPVLFESPDNFSGVFVLPSSEVIPQTLIERFSRSQRPVIVLDDDLTAQGLISIRPIPPIFVQALLDHLKQSGCLQIDCLNVQPLHSVIAQRIEQWQLWTAEHGVEGTLINEPVEPYTQPYSRGYEIIKSQLARGDFKADGLFCVTTPAAMGAMRALHEAGVHLGAEVAVCAVDGESMADYQIPALTTLEPSDVIPHLKLCLNWMLGEYSPWQGPLLMEPDEPCIVVRESTSRTVLRLQPAHYTLPGIASRSNSSISNKEAAREKELV
jgi:DNA-binding LacI/PurR family transcriptional regulator